MKLFWITANFVVTGLVALCPIGVMGADTSSPEARELADFAIAGLKDGRERLRSGVFRASGHRERELEDGRSEKQEYEAFCAFDFDQHLFRFDHLGSLTTSPTNKEKPRGGKYVRTKEQVVLWLIGSNQANVYTPEKLPPVTMKPFDVRLIGLVNYPTLNCPESPSWGETIAYYESSLSKAKKETPSLYTLSWVSRGENRFELTLDADQGFSPVRQEMFGRNSAGDFSLLKETDLTTWTKKNGVWVPTSISMEVRQPRPERWDLSFQWESVNEPVDGSLFTWEGMQLAKGTKVRDVRLGGLGIFVASVGETRALPKQKPGESASSSAVRIGIVGINVAILIVVVLVVLWRRRVAARATE